jgi:hypothetical protein
LSSYCVVKQHLSDRSSPDRMTAGYWALALS